MNSFRESLLQEILSQPTAPFREFHVISKLLEELDTAGVPHFVDPIGNIVLGVSSQREYLKRVRLAAKEPLRVYIAHMDHPGFHGVHWKSKTELQIKWHGGSPTAHLEGARVWLSTIDGWKGQGEMRDVQLLNSGRAIESGTVVFSNSEASSQPAPSLYGGLRFKSPYWKENKTIYTHVADDLVGCFAIVSMALDLWKKGNRSLHSRKNFLGLLTRAEEVGFIGAIGHFELGWLKNTRRPILCVSLETSRTLPGAEIGKGPVVRLGDRFTVFDSGALRVFSDLADQVLAGRHQRRIMDGGTCEASAAMVYGFPSIGISVPLGNYHNQSLEGGPDASPPNGPAPEFIHTHDIGGLIELCHALLKPKLPWSTPWRSKKEEFRKELKKYRPLLNKRSLSEHK